MAHPLDDTYAVHPDDDEDTDRLPMLLDFAASRIEELLEHDSSLTAEQIQRMLRQESKDRLETAHKTWHVELESGPFYFCGVIPGPDRTTWHTGSGPVELLERAGEGAHACALCLLAAARAIENAARNADNGD